MKILRNALLSLTLIYAGIATSIAASADGYLFNLLTKPTYLSSWKKLIGSEEDVPVWLKTYAKTHDGPTTPGKEIKLGADTFRLSTVCKAHDCADNQFVVLFSTNGTQAWGLLRDGAHEKFFGRPDDEKKSILKASMEE